MVSRPIALGLTLCDYVIVEERTKNVSLIGTFEGIAAERFPTPPRLFWAFSVLADGRGDGDVDLIVSRLDTDEEIYAFRTRLHFPGQLTEVRYLARIGQCVFPAPGYYQVTLLVDGEWVAQRRLRVYQRTQGP